MKLPVELQKVENSSNIRAMAYDATNEDLYVQFRADGDVYRYRDVPPGAWRLMQAAESKVAFLQKAIKPNHLFEKIDTGDLESEEAAG
jgi:hypothetical protein